MSYDNIHLGSNLTEMTQTPRFEEYTRVALKQADGTVYYAGDENGRTLEAECPFGSQSMANDILSQVRGYSYQPYDITGATPTPAAEMGDGISARGIYGALNKYNIDFNHLMPWDMSSDNDEELGHEFGYTDENGKFATYKGLRNGTTAVNGAGLIGKSVEGGSIADNTVRYGNVAFTGTLDQVGVNTSNIAAINAIFAGSAVASFMKTNQLYIGNARLYTNGITVNGTHYAAVNYQYG